MEIGDRVENINVKSKNYGEEGEITDVRDSDGKFEVTYDNGDIGYGQAKSYKVIDDAENDNGSFNDAPNKNKKVSFLKKVNDFFLSEPEKTYRKLGLKDSSGNLTEDGKEFLINVLWTANEATLVREKADAILADQESSKK